MPRRALICMLAFAAASGMLPATTVGHAATSVGPMDWSMYGHDLNRSFTGRSTLDENTVKTLAPAWFFPTGDAVTAQPVVVDGTVYVGSWDGHFLRHQRTRRHTALVVHARLAARCETGAGQSSAG
ncbi:MAG: PQQ-binding-like beta-propeller repeat protein [Candidatus Dormibacteria bacterium]